MSDGGGTAEATTPRVARGRGYVAALLGSCVGWWLGAFFMVPVYVLTMPLGPIGRAIGFLASPAAEILGCYAALRLRHHARRRETVGWMAMLHLLLRTLLVLSWLLPSEEPFEGPAGLLFAGMLYSFLWAPLCARALARRRARREMA